MKVPPDLIHERHDRKMEPFFWILTFECLSILLILALCMVSFPTYWAFLYKGWAYTLLILTLLGLWLLPISVRLLRKYIWENTHGNSYRLFQDRIEWAEYNKQTREKKEDAILLSSVQQVLIGRYVALYHYAYKKSRWTEAQPLAHNLPCLHIVHRHGMFQEAVLIPFYEPEDMDPWLQKFQESGIPVQLFVGFAPSTDTNPLLPLYEDPDYILPYTYEYPFCRSYKQLVSRMDQQVIELKRKLDSGSEGGDRI